VPPTAAPPAKKPILTLLKQARAFGIGLVLATQNPVDVDYKGLSNAGTWMIGRLQTEQDRARLLDGLSSAGGGVDVAAVGDTIGGLGTREFLMREPGAEAPALFTTRWAMSYLRGPLTREQIATLMAGRREALGAVADARPAAAPEAAGDAVAAPPAVADGVPVRWLDPAAAWAAQIGAVPGGTRLSPALVTRVALLYDDDKLGVREAEEWEAVVFPLGQTVDPSAALAVDYDDRDLRTEAPAGASYVLTDAPLDRAAYFGGAEKAIVDHLYRSRTHQVLRNRELKLAARAGETPDEFAARCQATADQGADDAQAALRDRYEARIARARDAMGVARDRVAEAMLGGRRSARTIARDVGRAITGRSRSDQAARRVQTAENRAQDRQEALADLEADLAEELTAIDDEWSAKAAAVETVDVPLEKSDIRVTARFLVWVPTG
jgi:hypothetical protein